MTFYVSYNAPHIKHGEFKIIMSKYLTFPSIHVSIQDYSSFFSLLPCFLDAIFSQGKQKYLKYYYCCINTYLNYWQLSATEMFIFEHTAVLCFHDTEEWYLNNTQPDFERAKLIMIKIEN